MFSIQLCFNKARNKPYSDLKFWRLDTIFGTTRSCKQKNKKFVLFISMLLYLLLGGPERFFELVDSKIYTKKDIHSAVLDNGFKTR